MVESLPHSAGGQEFKSWHPQRPKKKKKLYTFDTFDIVIRFQVSSINGMVPLP